jgi:hypothetical protein
MLVDIHFLSLFSLSFIVTVCVCVLCYAVIMNMMRQPGDAKSETKVPAPPDVAPIVQAWQVLREATLEIPASVAHDLGRMGKEPKPTFIFMMQDNCPGCGSMYAEWLALTRALPLLEVDVDLVKINISRDKEDAQGKMLHQKLKCENVPAFYYVTDGSWDTRRVCTEMSVEGWVKFIKGAASE